MTMPPNFHCWILQVLITAIAGLCCVSCQTSHDPRGDNARVDNKWKLIKNTEFSFSLPPSFKKTEGTGIDSFVQEYVAEGIEVSFDFGRYSNDFQDWPKKTKFEELKIDGRAARIGTAAHEFGKGFPYSTQVHIKLGGAMALSMFAACRSEKELAVARRIFETIAFKTK